MTFLRANSLLCVTLVEMGAGGGADDDNDSDGRRERARRERRGHISLPPHQFGRRVGAVGTLKDGYVRNVVPSH